MRAAGLLSVGFEPLWQSPLTTFLSQTNSFKKIQKKVQEEVDTKGQLDYIAK
jgi:hypothetical protein